MNNVPSDDKVRRFLEATPEQQDLIERILAGRETGPGAGLNEVLSKKTLAPRLHVTPRTIENWQKREVLPYIKIGKIVLFVWGDVLEAIKKFRVCRKTYGK